MTRFRWGLATDTGRTRSINQDNALAIEGLFAVADGMGGHRGGEVASEVAVRALRERAPLVTSVELLEAIHLANDERLAIANVGDSRVYLFASGELEQMTDDHSLVAALVREGRLTPQEAEEHPQRNILTRALGIDHEVSVDAWEVPPFVGDRWVLCSDGLFNEVSVDQMAAVLRRLADPSEAASELVRLANDSGGRDNITVLVDIVDDEGHAAIAPSTGGAVTDNGPGPAFAAGIDGATDESSTSNGSSARARRSTVRPRFTWRVAAFLLTLVVLAGAVVVAFAVYGSDDAGDSPPPLTVTFAPPTTTSTSTSSTTTLLTSTSTTAVSATTASTTTATSTPG
jgi:serine/threonine protein phosphatase PrpC